LEILLRKAKIDYELTVLVVILTIFGLFILKSAVYSENIEVLFKKQIIWDLVGFSLFILIVFFNFNSLISYFPALYVFSVIMLIGLFFFGERISGAIRWYNFPVGSFQPSEFAKISTIGFLGIILKNKGLKNFILSMIVMVIPAALVILEPDLGTAIVFFIIWFVMIWVGNFNKKYIMGVILILSVMIPLFFFFGLKDYQRARILSFLNPNAYKYNEAYHLIQSIRTVGSGGLSGRGYMRGPSNLYGYLPADHTDFIFAVLAEELGFLGTTSLIILYLLLYFKIYRIFKKTVFEEQKLIISGIFAMIAMHSIQNIGMNLGLLPITGLPLPFFTYGGSSTIFFFLSLGLIHNISVKLQ